MAFLSGGIQFEGSLGDYSAYKMKGSNRIVFRLKGGPSKNKIKKDPRMVNTRRTMSEFGAASKAAARITQAIRSRKGWSMHGVQGDLTARLMHLRKTDTQSAWGERGIRFSQSPRLLEGFALSQGAAFDACITTPLLATVSRETLSAHIELPELVPGVNLILPEDRPQFRLVAELITVPDFIYVKQYKQFEPISGYSLQFDGTSVQTDWYASKKGSSATTLQLNLEVVPPGQHHALMLCIGLQLGVMHDSDTVEMVPKTGTAKILAMV